MNIRTDENRMKRTIDYLRTARLYYICCTRKNLLDVIDYLPEDIIKSAMCICVDRDKFDFDATNEVIVVQEFVSGENGGYLVVHDCIEVREHEFAIIFYGDEKLIVEPLVRLKLLLARFGLQYKKCGILYKNEYCVLVVYSSMRRMVESECKEITLHIASLFTYGDCYILYVLIKAFLNKYCSEKVTIYHASAASYRIFTQILKEITHIDIRNNQHILNFLESDNIRENIVLGNFINTDFDLEKHGKHIIQLFMDAMHLVYADISVIINKISLTSKIINSGMHKSKRRIKIGVQFYSSTDDRDEGNMTYPLKKSWPFENAQRFVDICVANGFEVFQLTAHGTRLYKKSINCVDISFDLLYNMISTFDIFIGIDSVFGHISAVQGVKNLTIFGGGTAYWTYLNTEKDKYNISFVPFRLNYSLSSWDGDIRKISPEKVFNTMRCILCGTIKLEEEIVLYDTINNEYVDELIY